jgi:hypothetical protein
MPHSRPATVKLLVFFILFSFNNTAPTVTSIEIFKLYFRVLFLLIVEIFQIILRFVHVWLGILKSEDGWVHFMYDIHTFFQ